MNCNHNVDHIMINNARLRKELAERDELLSRAVEVLKHIHQNHSLGYRFTEANDGMVSDAISDIEQALKGPK